MAGGRSRISEGPGGAAQLRFRALWDCPGEGKDPSRRGPRPGIPAVPQRVEDGGPGSARGATCAAMDQPAHWIWQLGLVLSYSSCQQAEGLGFACATNLSLPHQAYPPGRVPHVRAFAYMG